MDVRSLLYLLWHITFILIFAYTNIDSVVSAEVTTQIPSTATPVTPEPFQCESYNNSCEDCVRNKQCYYCNTKKFCRNYPFTSLRPMKECGDLSDMRYLTCIVGFETLAIVLGVIGGIVIIGTTITCCCCCRKYKRAQWQRQQDKWERQRQERKAAAEERRAERQTRTDEIRQKYGIMTDANKYKRFE